MDRNDRGRTTRSYAESEESSVVSRDRRRLADESDVSRRAGKSFVTLRTRFDRENSNVTHHDNEARHETRAGAPMRRNEPIYDDASMTSADTYRTGRTAERVNFRKGGYARSDVSDDSRVDDRFARRSYPASVVSDRTDLSADDDGFSPYGRKTPMLRKSRYPDSVASDSVVTESVVPRRRRSPRSRSPADTESVIPRRHTRSRSPADTESVLPRRHTRAHSPESSVVPRRRRSPRSRSPADTESVIPRRRSGSPADTESVIPRRRTRSRSHSPESSVAPRRRTQSRSRSPESSVVPRRRAQTRDDESVASTASFAYTESSVAPAPRRRLAPASAYAGSVLSDYNEPHGELRTIRYAPSTGRQSYLHVRKSGIVPTPLNRQGSIGDVGNDSIISDSTVRSHDTIADEYTPRTPAGRLDDREAFCTERPSRSRATSELDTRSAYSRRPPLMNRGPPSMSESSPRSSMRETELIMHDGRSDVTASEYSRSDEFANARRQEYRRENEQSARPNESGRPELYIRGPTAGRLSPVNKNIHQEDNQSVYARGRPRLMARGSHARSRSLDSFRETLSMISRNSEGTISADAFSRSNFAARSVHRQPQDRQPQDQNQDDDDENLGVPPSKGSVHESMHSRRNRHMATPASRVGRARSRDGGRRERARSVDSRVMPLVANNLMKHERMTARNTPGPMGARGPMSAGPAGPPSEITIHLNVPNKANGGSQAASVMSVQQRHPDGSVTDIDPYSGVMRHRASSLVTSAAQSDEGELRRMAENARYQGSKSPAPSMASRGRPAPLIRRPLPMQRSHHVNEEADNESVGNASTAYHSDRTARSQVAPSQAPTAMSKCEQFVLCPKKIHKLRQGLRSQLIQEDQDYEVCWRCDHCNLYVEGPDFVINPWHCACGYDLCNRCYEHFLAVEDGQARHQTKVEDTEEQDRKRRILQWAPKN